MTGGPVSLQPSTSFNKNSVGCCDTPSWVCWPCPAAVHPPTQHIHSCAHPVLSQVSFPENKAWPCSAVSYLHRRLGNMWSELHFMKAAATHDMLSVPGDLWGCMVLMVSVGLVSSPYSFWPLSLRQMGDKPFLARLAQQEGMAGRGRPGADHPSLLGKGSCWEAPGGPPRAARKSKRPPGGRKPPCRGVPALRAFWERRTAGTPKPLTAPTPRARTHTPPGPMPRPLPQSQPSGLSVSGRLDQQMNE